MLSGTFCGRGRERGEGEFMSYFEILVHSLVSVDIPKDRNLPSPSHSVIFYKRITYNKVAHEDLLVCIILVA
jgi:hypothetical protein